MAKIIKILSRILDVPILIFYAFGVAMLIFILYHSLGALSDLSVDAVNLQSKMLFVGLMLAVAAAVMKFGEDFIHGFAKTLRHLMGREEESKEAKR